jgi:hypothetical protein
VSITSPTNNQVLTYDSASSLWVNANNPADGVTSITATAPLTGGTITSTGSIGLDQTALSITRSQVSDFTSGTVAQAGTATYAVNSGTAIYATNSGTAVSASTAQQAGTATYATNAGTSVYATNSGTAVFATNASTAVSVSGSAITQSQVVNLVSDLAGKANLAGDNTFTGAQTVNGNIIAGASGFQFRSFNEDNKNVKFSNFFANVNEQSGMGQLFVENWIGSINAASSRRIGFYLNVPDFGTGFTLTTNADMYVTTTGVGIGTSAASVTSQLFVTSRAAARVGAVIRGAASQSADLLQLQNSAGVNLGRFDASGNMVVTGATRTAFVTNIANGGAYLDYQTETPAFIQRSASAVALRVQGASGQTANLLELQNNSGVNQASVNNIGIAQVYALGVSGNPSGISFAYFTTPLAGVTPVVVRGAASQTADLLQIQNSAGAVQARISSSGIINATSLRTNNTLFAVGESNSGGNMYLVKQTGSPGNPGTDGAFLYFRDGTNAGTLKLVVRAGAAGAETTILDNIPQ